MKSTVVGALGLRWDPTRPGIHLHQPKPDKSNYTNSQSHNYQFHVCIISEEAKKETRTVHANNVPEKRADNQVFVEPFTIVIPRRAMNPAELDSCHNQCPCEEQRNYFTLVDLNAVQARFILSQMECDHCFRRPQPLELSETMLILFIAVERYRPPVPVNHTA